MSPTDRTHPQPVLLPEGEGIANKESSIGEFPKCTEDDRACRKGFPPGALLWVTFLGHARKVTTGEKMFVIQLKNGGACTQCATNRFFLRSIPEAEINTRGKAVQFDFLAPEVRLKPEIPAFKAEEQYARKIDIKTEPRVLP